MAGLAAGVHCAKNAGPGRLVLIEVLLKRRG
jgi:hypothetical protein